MKKTRRNSPPLTESEKRGQKNTNTNKIVQAFGGDATRQSTKFAPQSPKQAKKEKEIMAREKRRAARNKFERKTKAIMTLGGSEVARKIVKSDIGKKTIGTVKRGIKGAIDAIKKVPSQAMTTGFNKKPSSFKMKKFSGFGNESPAKMKGDPNDMRAKIFKSGEFKDIISKKPASAGQKAVRGFSNAAKTQRKATAKIGRKVAGKLGSKLLGPVGAALAIKDAYGTYKDIKKGMKPSKAARKNFLGF